MQTDEISAAIYNYLITVTNDFGTALIGGMHYADNTTEPKDVVYPYAIYQLITADYDKDTGKKWVNPIIRFTIYDDDDFPATLQDVGNKLDARFDDSEASITMTSYWVIGVDRTIVRPDRKTPLDRWEQSRDYRMQLQEK